MSGAQEITEADLGWVRAVALKIARGHPSIEADDLIQEGVIGLMEAARVYDGRDGCSLRSFAGHRVVGAMRDHLRSIDRAARSTRVKQRRIARVEREVAQRVGRDPFDQEVADALGWSVERLDAARQDIIAAAPVDPESFACSIVPAPDASESERDAEETAARLESAVAALPERERAVISLYFYGEMLEVEIGAVLGVTESRIDQILKAALRRLEVILDG